MDIYDLMKLARLVGRKVEVRHEGTRNETVIFRVPNNPLYWDWQPHIDRNQAWEIVDDLKKKGWELHLIDGQNGVVVEFKNQDEANCELYVKVFAEAPTVGMAICKAALETQ